MVTDRVVGTAEVTPGVARESVGVRRPAGPIVALACLLTLALHLLYITGPLLSDEGGVAMVARWWSSGGDDLYGPQWVDRPPGLIATFWVANLLGPYGVRIVAGLMAAAFVLAAGWAGWAARGGRAAAWSAWAAFFLMNAPLTQTFALNGELVAATWTMVGVAAGIHAVRGRVTYRAALALGALAGVAAASAVLAKQNFADAAVFLLVLGLAEGLTVRERRRLLAVAGAAGAGFALPVSIAAGWAYAHSSLGDLVYAMYGFRVDASMVIARWAHAGPDSRLRELLGIALLSGIATLAVAVLVAGRRHVGRRSPLVLACVAGGLVEIAGVALGGNYSPHYLVGLAPMLALAAGVLAVQPGRGRWLVRLFVVVPVVATLVASPAAAVQVTRENTVQATGTWLARAAERGDSVVVLYTHANVVNASGLRPVYPYAWSLPIRTLDPQLALLAATLTDPRRAPTWVVGWDALGTWGLDADHRVAAALATDYVRFATVCDRPIWLRRGFHRTSPPDPCAGTGIQESSIESAGEPPTPGSLPAWTSSPGVKSRSWARGRSSPAGPARSPGWSSPSGCSTGGSAGGSATTRRASST